MDQQHPSNPAAGQPGMNAGVAGPQEAPGTPTSTVVAEGEWLAVSTEGFSEQQRGRPLEHLVKELVQNALDSVGGSGRIDLVVTLQLTARLSSEFYQAFARCSLPKTPQGSPHFLSA